MHKPVSLHYIDHPGSEPTMVLLHGLTANAHAFDGLMDAGLSHRVIAADLRGRGLSPKPATGYSLADHAADVIDLLDRLNLTRVVLGGHSFGALLSMYVAAKFPDRVESLILLDISHEVPGSKQVYDMICPSLNRLGQCWRSWNHYLSATQQAPYFQDWWDTTIESYLRADLETLADGSVRSRVPRHAIEEVLEKMPQEPWPELVASIQQPTLLVHAPDPFGSDRPLISRDMIERSAELLTQARLVTVPGNHLTMLYDQGASQIVKEIQHSFSLI